MRSLDLLHLFELDMNVLSENLSSKSGLDGPIKIRFIISSLVSLMIIVFFIYFCQSGLFSNRILIATFLLPTVSSIFAFIIFTSSEFVKLLMI